MNSSIIQHHTQTTGDVTHHTTEHSADSDRRIGRERRRLIDCGRRALLCAFICMTCVATVRAGEKPTIPDEVKKNVQNRVAAGLTPAIVVGIITPDGEVYFADGVTEMGESEKVGPDTVFEIGSITKSFTGILLADMVQCGEVKLDDPVRKYLPEGTKLPSEEGREITLEDLATHRSGLPRMPTNFLPADPQNPFADYSAERMYEFLAEAKLDRKIGADYDYSNLGMGLLGHALARAAGKDYGTLIRERVCLPLGLKITSLTADEEPGLTSAKAHTVGGSEPKVASAWTWSKTACLAGAGGLRSTAREMLRYVACNSGLIDTPLKAAMDDAHKARGSAGSPQMGIALGWHLLRAKTTEAIVWHNGGTGGFHSYCGYDPKTQRGVVVWCNSTENIDDIGIHLLDDSRPLKEIERAISVDEATLAKLDGYYDLGGATIQVTHEGSQLFAQLTGQDRYPVFAKSATRFFYRVVPAELEFDVQPDGSATKLTLHQAGRTMPARKLSKDEEPKQRVAIEVKVEKLEEYVGKYELQPGITLDVQVQEGKLTCQVSGQGRTEIFAEAPDEFFYKVVDAQITFERDANGKVTSLTLHQGGMDHPAKRAE